MVASTVDTETGVLVASTIAGVVAVGWGVDVTGSTVAPSAVAVAVGLFAGTVGELVAETSVTDGNESDIEMVADGMGSGAGTVVADDVNVGCNSVVSVIDSEVTVTLVLAALLVAPTSVSASLDAAEPQDAKMRTTDTS